MLFYAFMIVGCCFGCQNVQKFPNVQLRFVLRSRQIQQSKLAEPESFHHIRWILMQIKAEN